MAHQIEWRRMEAQSRNARSDYHKFRFWTTVRTASYSSAVCHPDSIRTIAISVCPGKHMGLSLFWISVVSLLHSFNISQAFDGAGDPIEPKVEYVSSVLKYVNLFSLPCFLSLPPLQHSCSI